jgi:hypothetical protein
LGAEVLATLREAGRSGLQRASPESIAATPTAGARPIRNSLRPWDDAFETGTDFLEEQAIKRAMEFSDHMMITMLRPPTRDLWREAAA